MTSRALVLAVNMIVLLAFALAVYGGVMQERAYIGHTIDWEVGIQQQVP